MIGKAGVWGHFGSWNFERASMYNQAHNKPREEGINLLVEKFGLNEEEASDMYYEIKTNEADRWVSPWPGYQGTSGCSIQGELALCNNGVMINLTDYDVKLNTQGGIGIPHSIVYVDGEDSVI